MVLILCIQKLPIEHSTTCDSRIHMNCVIEYLYIYKTEMSVHLSVCPSRLWGGGGGGYGRGGGKGVQEGGRISQMECLGGDTFLEQR